MSITKIKTALIWERVIRKNSWIIKILICAQRITEKEILYRNSIHIRQVSLLSIGAVICSQGYFSIVIWPPQPFPPISNLSSHSYCCSLWKFLVRVFENALEKSLSSLGTLPKETTWLGRSFFEMCINSDKLAWALMLVIYCLTCFNPVNIFLR